MRTRLVEERECVCACVVVCVHACVVVFVGAGEGGRGTRYLLKGPMHERQHPRE